MLIYRQVWTKSRWVFPFPRFEFLWREIFENEHEYTSSGYRVYLFILGDITGGGFLFVSFCRFLQGKKEREMWV